MQIMLCVCVCACVLGCCCAFPQNGTPEALGFPFGYETDENAKPDFVWIESFLQLPVHAAKHLQNHSLYWSGLKLKTRRAN